MSDEGGDDCVVDGESSGLLNNELREDLLSGLSFSFSFSSYDSDASGGKNRLERLE